MMKWTKDDSQSNIVDLKNTWPISISPKVMPDLFYRTISLSGSAPYHLRWSMIRLIMPRNRPKGGNCTIPKDVCEYLHIDTWGPRYSSSQIQQDFVEFGKSDKTEEWRLPTLFIF